MGILEILMAIFDPFFNPNVGPGHNTYVLPYREPRYGSFKPPKYWDCQCLVCHARIDNSSGDCWYCKYGPNCDNLRYYNEWGTTHADGNGHRDGKPIKPDCQCNYCKRQRGEITQTQRKRRSSDGAPYTPADPNTEAMRNRIEDAFRLSDFGNYHQNIEVQWDRGQWFIHCFPCGAMWSVEACVEPAAIDGFYFEIMCEGNHYCNNRNRDHQSGY